MFDGRYLEIGAVAGVFAGSVTFLAAWIYCIFAYGFLLGVGLGWLPALITGFVVFGLMIFLWLPVMVIVAGSLVILSFLVSNHSALIPQNFPIHSQVSDDWVRQIFNLLAFVGVPAYGLFWLLKLIKMI